MKLQNKTIVITGGSSGLGLALAKKLYLLQNNIVLIARNTEKLKVAKAEIVSQLTKNNNAQTYFSEPLIISADIKNSKALTNVIKKTITRFKKIDFLINSAGVLLEQKVEDMNEKDYQHIIDINLLGTIRMVKATLPELKKSQGGILNIASMAGLFGVFGYSAYCASKHALIGFSKALYFELHQYNISVGIVCPPEFKSPMLDELNKDRSPENIAHAQMVPQLKLNTIVKATIKGIKNKKLIIIPGIMPKLANFADKMVPRFSALLAKLIIKSASKA